MLVQNYCSIKSQCNIHFGNIRTYDQFFIPLKLHLTEKSSINCFLNAVNGDFTLYCLYYFNFTDTLLLNLEYLVWNKK